jgi:hypothetical protein
MNTQEFTGDPNLRINRRGTLVRRFSLSTEMRHAQRDRVPVVV